MTQLECVHVHCMCITVVGVEWPCIVVEESPRAGGSILRCLSVCVRSAGRRDKLNNSRTMSMESRRGEANQALPDFACETTRGERVWRCWTMTRIVGLRPAMRLGMRIISKDMVVTTGA